MAIGWSEPEIIVAPLDESAQAGVSLGWLVAGITTVVVIQIARDDKNKLPKRLQKANLSRDEILQSDPPIPSHPEPAMSDVDQQAFAEFTRWREDETHTLPASLTEYAGETKRPWLQKLLLIVPLLFASFCFCFWQALPGWTGPDVAQAVTAPTVPERTLQTRRIDEIRPGMRVLADNPIVEDTHPDSPEPDPLLDRLIQLRMKKADETDVLISLIRPLDWIQFHDAHPGVLIHLDYEEFRAVGEAEVLQILPCPAIESGQGEVVTGTFQHTTHELLEIWVEGEDQPIRTTLSHRWWSEDRGDFVTASELQENEALRLASGEISTVAKITKVQSAETVYNLEVNRKHAYYVGASGVIVHNAYALPVTRAAQHGSDSHHRRMVEEALILKSGYGVINVRTNQALSDGSRTLSRLRPDVQYMDENGLIYIIEINRTGGNGYHEAREALFKNILGDLFGGYNPVNIK